MTILSSFSFAYHSVSPKSYSRTTQKKSIMQSKL